MSTPTWILASRASAIEPTTMIALISAAIGVVKSIAQSTRGDGALGAVLSSINGKLDIAITRLASIQSSLEFLIGQVASLREELFEALGQQYTYQLHNEVVAAIRKVRNIYKRPQYMESPLPRAIRTGQRSLMI